MYSLETQKKSICLSMGTYNMLDYIYAGIIVFFLLVILVIAKVEDGEDMDDKDEEEEQ